MKNLKTVRRAGIICIILATVTATVARGESEDTPVQISNVTTIRTYKEDAIQWLLDQQVPNDTVPEPHPARRNLIVSYRIPQDDPVYPDLHGRSFIYDDAVTAVALTMAERYDAAESVLLALSRQLRDDGSMWFGVDTQNAWPAEDDHSGAMLRSGATAWVGYAATLYLRARRAEGELTGAAARVSRRIEAMATSIAGKLLERQVTDSGDRRAGLVTGGVGSFTYSIDDSGEMVGQYDSAPVGWASTEHNIDAYFLFRDLAEISGSDRYAEAADRVRAGLLSLWSEEHDQLIQGVKADGTLDTVLPLDGASWGSLFLRTAGEREKSDAALDAALSRFQLGNSGHFRPYARDEVYESNEIPQTIYGDPDRLWSEVDLAWIEGGLGVVAALVQADRTEEAARILRAAEEFEVEGGFRYADREVPEHFSTFPSAASTAWYVIAAELLLDPADRQRFWGGG